MHHCVRAFPSYWKLMTHNIQSLCVYIYYLLCITQTDMSCNSTRRVICSEGTGFESFLPRPIFREDRSLRSRAWEETRIILLPFYFFGGSLAERKGMGGEMHDKTHALKV